MPLPPHPRRLLAVFLLLALPFGVSGALGSSCTVDSQCGAVETCHGEETCGVGVCVPALSLATFPIALPGVTAYNAATISVLDHAGGFYTGCCDTRITAFTGAEANREDGAVLCPAEPVFPACLFASCLCGYRHAQGLPFEVTGGYSSPFGPEYLYYDGHAGWDYTYGFGVPLVAAAGGTLCKAVEDPINGRNGQTTAWDGFHTFYIDHGVAGGVGHASWYLHASDLAGTGAGGEVLSDLQPGACAPVAEGQLVATVGNFGSGAPHLHFEVRRYVPGDGAEAFSTRVIDPYGWRGDTTDPWADPLENPQASSLAEPTWIACGNGRRECGEECDDGNVASGDCCSATCAFEPGGAACNDGNACTTGDVCDGTGSCAGNEAPASVCRTALHGAVRLRDRFPDTGDTFQWTWTKGASTTMAELGDPVNGTTRYDLCVYDESAGNPTLALRASVPAGGLCRGRPCWSAGTAYRYTDRDASAGGVRKIILKPGADGSARIVVKGKGEPLEVPGLPLTQQPQLTVQLKNDVGGCWGSAFPSPAIRSDAVQFKDKL